MKNKIIVKFLQICKLVFDDKSPAENVKTDLHNAEIEMLRQRVFNAEMAQVLFVAGRLAQI